MWALLAVVLILVAMLTIDVFGGIRARARHNSFDWKAVAPVSDFTVLVPLYGNVKYLENTAYLGRCSGDVVLCTTSGETKEFYAELETIAAQYGLRIYRSPHAPVTTTKKRRTGGTIRDRIVRDALNQLHKDGTLGTYTVCIDADTTTEQPLNMLVGALQQSKADFASVQLVPQTRGSMLVQLQRHEYRLSMKMRWLVPWLLSGACHAGTSEAFRAIMNKHSLFFQGNDVETGLLGDLLGYKATHIPFSVYTNIPSSFRSWWRQRIAWSGGEFRLFIINCRYVFKHPFLWIYGGLIVILLLAARWWFLLNPGWVILGAFLLYAAIITYIHWPNRNWWLLLMPFYSLVTNLIMPAIGVVWYFVMAIPERNFGIIRPRRKEAIV